MRSLFLVDCEFVVCCLGAGPIFLVDWLTNSLFGLDGWGLARHDVIVAKRMQSAQIVLLCSCLQPVRLNKSIIIHRVFFFNFAFQRAHNAEGVRLTLSG